MSIPDQASEQAKTIKELMPEGSLALLKALFQSDQILPFYELLIFLQKGALQKLVRCAPEDTKFFQGSHAAYANLTTMIVNLLNSYGKKKRAKQLSDFSTKALYGFSEESLVKLMQGAEQRQGSSDNE